jgi:hypothetical protein
LTALELWISLPVTDRVFFCLALLSMEVAGSENTWFEGEFALAPRRAALHNHSRD